MSIIVGGTNGVTYPDGSNTSAINVNTQLSPAITDVSNVMTISKSIIDGTNGIFANGVVSDNGFFRFNLTTNSNVDLRVLAISAGWNQTDTLWVTIPTSNIISSVSTSSPALTITGSFPNGLKVINNGTILGKGGAGGQGAAGNWNTASSTIAAPSYAVGSAGGNALTVSTNVIIDNTNGFIYGGGGGGGGGGSGWWSGGQGGGGGGGGGGIGSGAGGALGVGYPSTPTQGGVGIAGTATTVGTGGAGYLITGAYVVSSGAGGSGGTYGTAGSTGVGGGGSTGGSLGGTGGAAGSAVAGNSYITWINTGTTAGAVA